MTNRQVLLVIAAFVILSLGSFIWYVLTWDPEARSSQTSFIILPQILPPEAPALQRRAVL